MTANPIVLRRTDTIGAADAESDQEFLSACFIDSGQVDQLLDPNSPQCIVLGRTGAGKTALLLEMKRRVDNAIELSPEALSLSFLTNSNVLNFFEAAGVQLDPFYKLLWQHVFCVELIKAKYKISNEQAQNDFFSKIGSILTRDHAKKAALDYLQQWGSQFWNETTSRMKEFTTKLEDALTANAGISLDVLELGATGASKLTEEQKFEVTQHGQKVISDVHIHDLHNVINLMRDNIFDDEQSPYYLLIDRLDENWVDERIRHKLIRALIEAVRAFRKVRNAKVLVSLRTDLLFTVLHRYPQAGFQTEKYETLYSRIPWSREALARLLDMRTQRLFRRRYTQHAVTIYDILPNNQIAQKSTLDHILDRTFFRPREAILFVNDCIQRSDGKTRISLDDLKATEATYSQRRLNSLYEEWAFEYPCLPLATAILSRRDAVFSLGSITEDDTTKIIGSIIDKAVTPHDPLASAATSYMDMVGATHTDFLSTIVPILYQVGLVGLKLAPHLGVQWSYIDEPIVKSHQLSSETDLHVHKTFWIALNVTTKHRRERARAHDYLGRG